MKENDIHLGIGSRQKDVWIKVSRTSGDSGYARAMVDTTENWESDPTYVPANGLIIIYIDHGTIIREGESIHVPGIKIGDGSAYLNDLPFVGEDWQDILENHIQNTGIHVSLAEKTLWNTISDVRQLPIVASTDNGKVLKVINGTWTAIDNGSVSKIAGTTDDYSLTI